VNEKELMAELADALEQSAARLAAAIRRFGDYRWVGIYEVSAEEIGVVGWDGPGPPAHPRFPRTEGLCGAAVHGQHSDRWGCRRRSSVPNATSALRQRARFSVACS
jgi:putative methionine-R-sulfoxide reductase with GAF domain